jgi:hypothetical protein
MHVRASAGVLDDLASRLYIAKRNDCYLHCKKADRLLASSFSLFRSQVEFKLLQTITRLSPHYI